MGKAQYTHIIPTELKRPVPCVVALRSRNHIFDTLPSPFVLCREDSVAGVWPDIFAFDRAGAALGDDADRKVGMWCRKEGCGRDTGRGQEKQAKEYSRNENDGCPESGATTRKARTGAEQLVRAS